MSQNPYAPPQAASLGAAEPLRRKRWIAVLLSVALPPIGMLYVVRPLRAIVYLAAGVLIYPGAVMAAIAGIANAWTMLIVAIITWRFVAAVEGYRLAPSWRGGSLPWHARAPALVAFFVAAWLSLAALRAFVVEPFRIPSASMRPTLQVGDHIFVSKTAYGWDIPLTGGRLLRFAGPRRGDVAVFRYPGDRSLSYVMRVVGQPGDSVAYVGKRLIINGRAAPTHERGSEDGLTRYEERLDEVTHAILVAPQTRPYMSTAVGDFPNKEQCRYDDAGFACKVPARHYFVMGDNRDNTNDSRYWGFVPEDDFIGRAFLVWSARDPVRAGTSVQ
jgi:signal peptidase I